MIFVTLGTHELPFNRLLNELEKIDIGDNVVIQCGNTDFKSSKYEVVKFLDKERFDYYMENSDLVICHGGVGSILQGLKYNKNMILAPRLSKYNEHNDDHQIEICNKFHKDHYAIIYNECDDLKQIILKVKKIKFKKYNFDNSKILNYISNYLDLKVL
jgi:UDP-N-acetylglucosamine transferase subunit ALG13